MQRSPGTPPQRKNIPQTPEWPTLGIAALSYGAIATVLFASNLSLWISLPLLSTALALHSSLQHEVLHGHPFMSQQINDLLVFPAVGLFIPYQRFRDDHLRHHKDPNLTDPYDDPESNFLDPVTWHHMPRGLRGLLRMNNTLAGRMLLGPLIGLAVFYAGDVKRALGGDRAVIRAYLWHGAGLLPVVAALSLSAFPLWAYGIAAYLGMSLLKIRTFAEHRAHEACQGRSVVIEDRGPLALLFLNNNLHIVHHAHPQIAWYRLPALYRSRKDEFLTRNRGYLYRSYGALFRQYLFRAKDPVPHPLRPTAGDR